MKKTGDSVAWAKARVERRAKVGPFHFPVVLRWIREGVGARRTEWAELLGVSREQVRNYENPAKSLTEVSIQMYVEARNKWVAKYPAAGVQKTLEEMLLEGLEWIRDLQAAGDSQ